MRSTSSTVIFALGCALALAACSGKSGAGDATIAKGDAAHGKQVYLQTCASCHGESGKGDGPASAALNPKPADHTDKARIGGRTDEELSNIIKMGGGIVGKPTMPAFPQLSSQDVSDLVAHLRLISGSEHH